jgi:hypothetical protein
LHLYTIFMGTIFLLLLLFIYTCQRGKHSEVGDLYLPSSFEKITGWSSSLRYPTFRHGNKLLDWIATLPITHRHSDVDTSVLGLGQFEDLDSPALPLSLYLFPSTNLLCQPTCNLASPSLTKIVELSFATSPSCFLPLQPIPHHTKPS